LPNALAKVRLAISTSMKMPPEVSKRFSQKFGLVPAEAYGIIEIGLPFINTHPDATSPSTVGPILPGYQLRIANPDADGVGEVLIKGEGMFDAYFSPWRSREQCMDDEYFDTGDLGRVDEQGRLCLMGRSKTVLVCAGMKVFPEEVEEVVNTMPGIRASLVSGRDHPQFGQVPVAQVVMAHDVIDPAKVIEELRGYCFQRLSSYKVPVEFVQVGALPITTSGKLARASNRSTKP
jgi:long-chain acyl-CoA synthetase